MTPRPFPKAKKINGTRILLRVDWNVPISKRGPEDSLKLERTMPFLQELSKRGAKIILLTHLGRPKKREAALSTKRFLPLLKERYEIEPIYHKESVGSARDRAKLLKQIGASEPGSIHLLENVRFDVGEEKGTKVLAKAYAELGDLYVNNAFAACHRAHVSVAVLPKLFQSEAFAGPQLIEEVKELSKLLDKPKRPFIAVIGGKKLSTKIPVLKKLFSLCDAVLIGGAMASPFLEAAGYKVGASYSDASAKADAKRLLKKRNLFLPGDVMVMKKGSRMHKLEATSVGQIGSTQSIRDVGPATLAAWGALLGRAKTILWNGPIGIAGQKASGFGSRFIARVIGAHAKGPALGIAGGGDTIPVIQDTQTLEWFDFVSTGGGAILEFIEKDGKLPGLIALKR